MSESPKKAGDVRRMFDSIAGRYDLLNRLLSFGVDWRWRRAAVRRLEVPERGFVLDAAAGTCDVALELSSVTGPGVVVVAEDFSREMLRRGRAKVRRSAHRGRLRLAAASCERMPHPAASFDRVIVAFGIRNVADREAGLAEMLRVLKPGGRTVILEFSTPAGPVFGRIYDFYFLKILPLIGGLLSKRSAYSYLPASVGSFPSQDEFALMMRRAGFEGVAYEDLTFGIATVYTGEKPVG